MGRINGANSDYQYNGSGVIEVKPKPNLLYMKMYICPGGEKSPLETTSNPCRGTKAGCPGHHNGHAMIHLNQKDGVEIIAGDNNRILVDQQGNIELGKVGGAAKITLQNNGEIIVDTSAMTIKGNMTVSGNGSLIAGKDGVEMVGGNNNRILVKQNGDIELGKANGGAKITLTNTGAVIIDAGTITINGNVGINGNIGVTGDLTVSGNYPGK